MMTVIVMVLVGVLIYQLIKPPVPKKCGSANGPPVTSPRVRLRDGRYLAYKIRGAAKENSKHKVIFNHGFGNSKEAYLPVSDEWLQKWGICLISFDRPGYVESDLNPKRSPREDAFDIQDLADQLELGSKFYVIAVSIACYTAWGCLKYIPHRLAGVLIDAPIINYWWPSLPPELVSAAFRKLPLLDQWRFRAAHYSPKLAWLMHKCFPFPTLDYVLKYYPTTFSKNDRMILDGMSKWPSSPDEGKIEQQGAYESLIRDNAVAYGSWEFDPLELSNPFPDNDVKVHFWIGSEDRIVSVELQRFVVKKLPWMQCHEVPYGGHMFIHDPYVAAIMFKSLVAGEPPSFDF